MIRALREQLRTMIGEASSLDGVLAEGGEVPALDAAKGLVELDKLNARLARLSDRLQKATQKGKGPEKAAG
jgi:hypothetical protein